ncbi:MAG: TorF family putative porin [Rhodomicrobium sp.]
MALGGLKLALLTGAATVLAAGSGFAADLDLGVSTKDTPVAAADQLAWTVNAGVTSDYIFRGISQNNREPAGQGGLDVTYGMFYVGTWFSGVHFGEMSAVAPANAEVDVYAGVKPTLGPVTFDFGVITYNYVDKRVRAGVYYDPTYQEVKAGASVTVLKDLALSGTVYYSWDSFGDVGPATTIEGTASKPITKIGAVDLAASGTVGHVFYSDAVANGIANFDYTYGNVGLTATYKAVSVDVRWWDTDLNDKTQCPGTNIFQCGSAVAATLKITY